MSRNGHDQYTLGAMAHAIVIGSFEMRIGQRFDAHRHDAHQLAWCGSGVLAVTLNERTWILPPTRGLWIPARREHITQASSPTTMQSAYFRVRGCPIRWREPTPVAMPPLTRELVRYLAQKGTPKRVRAHAERLLLATLTPLASSAIEAPLPNDPRARRVADALIANPRDGRDLAGFAKKSGASARTLARVFVRETGMTFGEWRARTRVRNALEHLASGESVGSVAERVGYESSSAFIAAFRRQTGVSPSRYFA